MLTNDAAPAPAGVVVERHLLPQCYDCGLSYRDAGFADLVVSHEVWARISPTGHEGGLLCPTCLVRAAQKAGIDGERAEFRSGPFAVLNNGPLTAAPAQPTDGPSQPAPEAVDRVAAALFALWCKRYGQERGSFSAQFDTVKVRFREEAHTAIAALRTDGPSAVGGAWQSIDAAISMIPTGWNVTHAYWSTGKAIACLAKADREEDEKVNQYVEGVGVTPAAAFADAATKASALASQGDQTDAARPCTCHPDDNPPRPCPRKYALTECRKAADARMSEGKADG